MLALTRFHELDDIGDNDQISSEYSLITRLCLVNSISTKDDIDRARHGASRDVRRQLLEADLLPVHVDTVGVLEVELLAEASVIFTSHWLGEFVLLLDSLVQLLTLGAGKCANLQLRLDLSGTSDSSVNGHHFTELESLEISDLRDSRHVVEANGEPLGIADLVALVGEELGQTLTEIRLKSHVFFSEAVHEAWVLPRIAGHVRKVNVESARLVSLNFLREAHIIVDLLIWLVLHAGV